MKVKLYFSFTKIVFEIVFDLIISCCIQHLDKTAYIKLLS